MKILVVVMSNYCTGKPTQNNIYVFRKKEVHVVKVKISILFASCLQFTWRDVKRHRYYIVKWHLLYYFCMSMLLLLECRVQKEKRILYRITLLSICHHYFSWKFYVYARCISHKLILYTVKPSIITHQNYGCLCYILWLFFLPLKELKSLGQVSLTSTHENRQKAIRYIIHIWKDQNIRRKAANLYLSCIYKYFGP